MKYIRCFLFILLLTVQLFTVTILEAQDNWPRVITSSEGVVVTIYQPTPESFVGDKLKMRTAVSVKMNSKDAPKFGAIWAEAKMHTDRASRMVTLESITVTDVKFPGEDDQAKITKFKALLETEIPKWDYPISLDKLLATVEEENKIQDANLKNDPPTIYYRKEPTILVNIDGEPKLQKDEQMNMERVVNTPILIIKAPEDSKLYLYSGLWYTASDVKGTWSQASKLPSSIESIWKQIKEQELKTQKENGTTPPKATPSKIMISTKPAEVLQSVGEAKFTAIDKTKLLYMSNSDNDIFMDITSQKYFVLLSGRWYSSTKLEGPWSFVAADKLPADFAKIPEGSAKDGILASVAGTSAAREAVMDAQVPQTAAVDIATAKCTVTYDGEPKFEKIEGTSLELAMNTSTTVMRSGQTYYALDKGIWFKSASAKGPWAVADKRPEDVDNIPPSSSAYNSKYAYIYETTPTTVYVGYTPGYTGTYVYGPTVVYGTGYYYAPWYGAYYYPRPYTYGYGMAYAPYYGWGMHVSFHVGFYGGFYGGYYGGFYGGYHGHYHGHYHGGYYGHGGYNNINNINNININRNNNIYNNASGTRPSNGLGNSATTRPSNGMGNNTATTRPSTGMGNNTATTRPSTGMGNNSATTRPSNNVMTDRSGNVFQQNSNGGWNQNNGSSWSKANNSSASTMNRQQSMSTRGDTRSNNYQRGAGTSRSSSGGSRGGGGRSGGGRGGR